MPLFFDSSGQRVEQGASEARKRPSGAFVARCACRGVITPRASLVARSKKEVTTYVVTSFLDSGRKLKCSGEVNSPSAKVLLRKTLVRRKSADFLAEGRTGRERSEKTPQWGVCRPLCVSRCDNTASEPRRPLQKRGHNICCDLFFGFRQEIKMLGRSEFALRQGFAAQKASGFFCTFFAK